VPWREKRCYKGAEGTIAREEGEKARAWSPWPRERSTGAATYRASSRHDHRADYDLSLCFVRKKIKGEKIK